MAEILIIADDLTGAADCAVACGISKRKVIVAFGKTGGGIDAEVLSLDAGTRELDAQSAATEVEKIMRRHAQDAGQVVFKKLDSTLRGNVASELKAVLKVQRELRGKSAVIVLAPAFPVNGRTTVQGRQLVHGQPLEETAIGKLESIGASMCLK